ncbi:metalloregulator ArsR/SmtB family transcription factor [Herbivorax sp. ANBcel31]|uniref:ArsR/SmtB family transcription factor n=1 Tax=Herbivorax sp. ANBcel31 TaxID=3069754 RepID=UPI0027AFE663|nr:metalloregulator ArsR/SmtB family transcription factor [Herbivorax sp. ANBcel31]MDQ2087794.1 metalloregulator ArsR/SmtB family transcription factor [Herbivorax sp. ANBcel31]
MEAVVDVLKALADETRLRIINLLYEGEMCVCDIVETLEITQTKASRHLIYLKNAGLVKHRKKAQWVYYSLIEEEGNQFIDKLVYDKLRSMDFFVSDLSNYKIWIQNKDERKCK